MIPPCTFGAGPQAALPDSRVFQIGKTKQHTKEKNIMSVLVRLITGSALENTLIRGGVVHDVCTCQTGPLAVAQFFFQICLRV